MVKFLHTILGASLLLASTIDARFGDRLLDEDTANDGATIKHEVATHNCKSRELPYPEVIDMDEIAAAGETFTIDIGWMEIDPGFTDDIGYDNNITRPACGSSPFMTRALGGSVPGPTLKVSPGTTMKIKFRNQLTYQPNYDQYSSHVVVKNDLLGEMDGGAAVFETMTEMNLRRLNKFNDPDVSNLHFHGLHVSGILPSDDTTLEVLPQEEFTYVINIPEDHEPGLHWVHPHHHGSSTLQLVGGAALALIVKDPEDGADSSLPAEVLEADERVIVFQDWDIREALQTARHAGDDLLTESFSNIEAGQSIGQRFITINGKYQPITEIEAGKWERWRILYAGWQDLPLEFGFPVNEGNAAECEFYLMAKDGIIVSDYPRGPMLTVGGKALPIPPGGRADFMVRCNKPGETTRFEALSRRNVLILNCVEGDSEIEAEEELAIEAPGNVTVEAETAEEIDAVVQKRSASLTPWTKSSSDLPEYLQDNQLTSVSQGCTCGTNFEGYDDTSRVNGQIYRPGNYFMHTSYLGAVVDRKLKGMHEHSYHQHVYPYQLLNLPQEDDKDNAYFKIGDWQDTYLDKTQRGGDVTIRYRTTDIPGKIMVHCHNTLHADSGMIQKEYVRDTTDSACQCDIFGPINGEGIVDDVESAKVIGAADAPAADSAGSSVGKLGFAHLVAAVAGTLIGFGL